ncbi:MAG: sigma-54-dependent Fis family transcriptional regulator [Gammaproteobacteria bacterium]|nr:sigma-54-dependent Fis family transcriptional regulator [Gammaproteobacteria bacterium]
MSASILVIEDDRTLSKNIRLYLARHGYEVQLAPTGAEGLELVERIRPDIVLVDLMLPDMGGIELLMRIRSVEAHTIIIMMTGAGSVQAAVDAMKAGAHDYLSKPLVLKELKLLLDKTVKARNQAGTLSYYHDRQADRSGFAKIIGDSPMMNEIRSRIAQFLAAEAQLEDQEPPTVLITGETGTGKELIARAFHFEGPRRTQPFVELNCASIPAHLIEAELFGYERGAFTDAKQRKIGLVDAANGGTLFLDEIAEMDVALQAKLLTLLENRRVRRLGSVQEHEVNIRIIAATNQNLDKQVTEGRFRSDLYYRLRVINIHVPPLRERGDDIRLLATTFLETHAARYRKPGLTLNDDALALLSHYAWPGNVRELRNTMEQAVLLAHDNIVTPQQLLIPGTVELDNKPPSPADTSLNLEDNEVRIVRAALAKTGGNVTRAAELLGITRDTLRYRLNKHGITAD